MRRGWVNGLASIAVLLLLAPTAFAMLQPDQIALIVNKNVPDSQAIAEFYVKARQLPADRIIALDLPGGDEMSFDQYERIAVPGVRDFLEKHGLKDQVKCLATVYGVPLKIAARIPSPTDRAEEDALKKELVRAEVAMLNIADEAEAMAKREDPTFEPMTRERIGGTLDGSMKRIDAAGRMLTIQLQKTADPDVRAAKMREVQAIFRKMRSPLPGDATTAPATTTATPLDDAAINALAMQRDDPAARAKLRDALAQRSVIDFAQVVNTQLDYLKSTDTDAAFDNEIALLWWPNYPRERFLPNALMYNFLKSRTPPVVMVTRLDAPTAQQTRDLIATSVQVEREGLQGGIVVDGGGSMQLDPTGKNLGIKQFDTEFDALAGIVREKTKVVLTFDKNKAVLPPNSAKDVAIYCGWYSVGHYSSCCTFARGAVGYHVASYELLTLHNKTDGWCRGLMNDGVVATLGSVSEPFLGSFPMPDDFFELLMTGQFTLAEVYWRTSPLVSWKQVMIGDPLYRPYAAHPALSTADLPARLQPLVTTSP